MRGFFAILRVPLFCFLLALMLVLLVAPSASAATSEAGSTSSSVLIGWSLDRIIPTDLANNRQRFIQMTFLGICLALFILVRK